MIGGGWGGRYTRPQAESDWDDGIDINHFRNASDFGVLGIDGKRYSDHKTTIWRWRDAVQGDFAARMHRTLTDQFSKAGHPPVVDINSHTGVDPLIIKVQPGELHKLDASGSYNPDHGHSATDLDYTWMLYGDVNGFRFFCNGPEV